MSYDLSAETNGRLAKMCTAAGFTANGESGEESEFEMNFDLILNCVAGWHLQFTSNINTLLVGGTKFVLLAIQTKRAFTC